MTEPSTSASTPAPAPANWQSLEHAPQAGKLLGHVDDVQDGQVLMRDIFASADIAKQHPFKILLLRSGTDIKAYANRCAHFGVPLAAKQEQLKFQPRTSISCNVHYARYRWSDGVCDKGECEGETLIAIPVQVDAQGHIHIAKTA
jgi:nitrite reductase/ring-hydroxylating ferredoxin subunit